VIRSTIRDNTATGGEGGGLLDRGGYVRVSHSTISGNQATTGGGISHAGSLELVNSTISGNGSTGSGGGIYINGPASILSSTIADNAADSDDNGSGSGGGISSQYSLASPVLGDTILAGNHGGQSPDCESSSPTSTW